MTPPLIVLPEAEEEFAEAMRRYEARRPGLGLEFVGAVEQVLQRIAMAPPEFAPWPGDHRYRRAVVDRFPFIVVFEERPDALEVVSITHGARGPSYWSRRLR